MGQFYFQICTFDDETSSVRDSVSDGLSLFIVQVINRSFIWSVSSQAQQSLEPLDSGELTGLYVLSCLVLSCPVTCHVT